MTNETNSQTTGQQTPDTYKHTWSLKVAMIIGVLTLLLAGFLCGQRFEQRRMNHWLGWRDNYERNFFGSPMLRGSGMGFLGSPKHGFGQPPLTMRAHGLIGKILTVSDNKLTVQDSRDQIEQSVVINEATIIRRDGETAQVTDLQADQRIAVFGRPNDQGQIVAQLIRIFSADENPLP